MGCADCNVDRSYSALSSAQLRANDLMYSVLNKDEKAELKRWNRVFLRDIEGQLWAIPYAGLGSGVYQIDIHGCTLYHGCVETRVYCSSPSTRINNTRRYGLICPAAPETISDVFLTKYLTTKYEPEHVKNVMIGIMRGKCMGEDENVGESTLELRKHLLSRFGDYKPESPRPWWRFTRSSSYHS